MQAPKRALNIFDFKYKNTERSMFKLAKRPYLCDADNAFTLPEAQQSDLILWR